jgi:tetratricopeptide (TPR) repeat protein
MLIDRFYGRHSSDSACAVSAFEDAVHAVAAHRSVGDSLKMTLAADPDFIAAHALNGFGALILARAETELSAKGANEAVKRAAARHTLTAGESALAETLDFAVAGHWRRAVDRLDLHLDAAPDDFLAAKIGHAMRFMIGDREGMLRLTADLVNRSPKSGAGYGFLLGCHAFGLEESGAYDEAEAAGKRAVAIEPADSWGLHAVSHVFEMKGRIEEGRDWLTQSRPVWSHCNNFAFHMGWHLALLHLEAGDYDAVLAVYDETIRPVQTDDFRDMANAVSMLWRLEQEGVGVGDRWQGLYEVAYCRRRDTTYVFASLHYFLALIAAGDRTAAEELVEAMRQHKSEGCDQARVTRYIGLYLAEALIRMPGQCAMTGPCLTEMARRLRAIGGSHAQRDIFMRTLMQVAIRSEDYPSLRAIAALRREFRHEDRFHHMIMTRADGGPAPSAGWSPPAHPDHGPLVRLS